MRIQEAKWLSVPEIENSFWIFGKAFESPCDCKATLEICADRDLEAYLNGELLKFSQLADLPGSKSVTKLELNVRRGVNFLNVQVYNLANGTFATYDSTGLHGMAAIVYADNGNVLCASDNTWRFRRNDAYLPITDHVTSQLGFCFSYDARLASDWTNCEIQGEPAAVCEVKPSYHMREIPALDERDIQTVRLAQYGFFKRTKTAGSTADICASDFICSVLYDKVFEADGKDFMEPEKLRWLSDGDWLTLKPLPDGTDGSYVIYDLGRESVGFMKLNIDAPEGTIVDVAHGEHLDDGRVRCYIDGRNFADRYICHGGVNSFTHRLRRLGARYLELHISNCNGPVKIGFTTLVELCMPLPKASEFNCEDSRLLTIRKIGIDTLVNCMHEHYEDCPWREQALYSYDSRNQALYGYYIWGNYAFAKACFTMLGDNYMGNGQIAITAPREHDMAIEVFSLVWVSELCELYLFSGDATVIERNRDNICKVIDAALDLYDPSTGLYAQFSGKKLWRFFEWVKGLDGSHGDCPPEERLHALFNTYLLEAMKCADMMLPGKYTKFIAPLADAIKRNFYDEKTGYFMTLPGSDLLHQHTQALMIMNGILPDDPSRLYKAFNDTSLVPVSFSAMTFHLRAWMELSPETRRAMEDIVYNQFGRMLDCGATSFWETADGGDAFHYAGSMNHAWSSLPVMYCHRYVLGVEPLEPGFKKFRVRPYPGRLTHASGTVPTPSGDIQVNWHLCDGKVVLNVTAPDGLEAVLDEFPEFPLKK